jgi:hypothetical protein
MSQPYLFIHSKDPNCLKIVETLKQLNKDTLCRIVTIDGKQRAELPAFLKAVPTLYVPDTKDVYIGKDIYSYIAKPVTARREIPTATSSGAAAAATGASKEYQAWSFGGSGLTDAYSSWEAPGKFMGDDQLQYSFLGGGGPVAPAPREPETKQSYDGAKQGRNDDITARMEQYKKVRETEFKGISRQ